MEEDVVASKDLRSVPEEQRKSVRQRGDILPLRFHTPATFAYVRLQANAQSPQDIGMNTGP